MIVDAAIWVGAVGLLLAVLLVALALGTRLRHNHLDRRRTRVDGVWTPLMLASLRGDEPPPVPEIHRRDGMTVLTIWIRLTDALEGDGRDALVRFARHAGLDRLARSLLVNRDSRARLTGAVVAGRVADDAARADLRRLADAETALTERVQAARALLRIDPRGELEWVVDHLAAWSDCHPATAVEVLDAAEAADAAMAVGRSSLSIVDPAEQARLVRVLEGLRHPAGLEAVRALLRAGPDPEVAAACLRVVADRREGDDAELVRLFLTHDAAFVRVQAVAALGRIGAGGDEWRIAERLGDPDWWVRYRAAHSLVAMPRVTRSAVERLSRTHPDRYARGALTQALSEAEVMS